MSLPESHEALRAQSEARDDARRIAAAKVFIVLVVVAIAVYVLAPLGSVESAAPAPSPAHGRVCRPGPEITAPIDATVHIPGTVLEAHGVDLPPATPCEIDIAFATNGAWAALHETTLRCGAQTWKLTGDAAGRVGRRGALLAFAGFVDESSGAPSLEIDTEAGGALVRATGNGKQPFVVEIAVDRDRVVSSLAAGQLRGEAWAAAPGTHSVEWSDERKADGACYYASGPHGVEQYLGRRATVEPQRVRFWGGAELSRSGARTEPFARTFTSIEVDPVVVHESLRLEPTDAAGYEGEYAYEECDRDGKGCGKCRFSAHVALRAR